MSKFDDALVEFALSCRRASDWKGFVGAVYRTRLDYAFAHVKDAYDKACMADDEAKKRS